MTLHQSIAPVDVRAWAGERFRAGLARFDRARPVLVLGHFDADGLAALAILVRALRRDGWDARPRSVGKGENPRDAGFGATGRDLLAFLAAHRPAGADGHYGHGHAAATGGALRLPEWNAFATGLGFPEAALAA